jgi:hypothetical protein
MRLRPGKSDRDLRRRSTFSSTLDPAGLFHRREKGEKGDKGDRGDKSTTEYLVPERIAVSEDGGRPRSSEVERLRPSATRDSGSSPPASPRPSQNPRRFSMLRFRHASDSQLSATAKEHAARDAPPVPPVPASAERMSNERM